MKKIRVYEAAKEFHVSSEALLDIIRGLGIEVKSHMSSIDDEAMAKLKQKFVRVVEDAKEDLARMKENEAVRARETAQAQSRPGAPRPAAPRPASYSPPPSTSGQGPSSRPGYSSPPRPRTPECLRSSPSTFPIDRIIREQNVISLRPLNGGFSQRRQLDNSDWIFKTVFQLRPVQRVLSFLSTIVPVNFDSPMPSG